MRVSKPQPVTEVNFSEWAGVRYLHLGSIWVQGSMKISAPFDIELEYVRRMMVWLLFVAPDSVPQRHAMQLGLGAAALTKFCYHRLHMRTTAIEINPQVVTACRTWFKLPPDDERLHVVLADAEQEISRARWQGTVDALQVDLYDHEAAAPVLDSADFYAACRRLLTPDGCLTVNLFGRQSSYARSLAALVEAFGADALWAFAPTREGNTVVLAQARATRPSAQELATRLDELRQHYRWPAGKWGRLFQPIAPIGATP